MAFTIVTAAEMQFMAGEQVDATGDVTANHQYLHDYAAAYLSNLVQLDIIANWSSLTANTKPLFTEWAARFAACDLVLYNTAAYTNGLIEAEDRVQFHVYRMERIEKALSSMTIKEFLGVDS